MHCAVAPEVQYRGRKTGRGTARSRRKCSTEAEKQAGALHCCAGSAVQKPENGPGHCTVAPRVQCGSRKTGQGTAKVSWKCSTEAGKRARALHGRAESAVQKPESNQEHCKSSSEVHCRSQKSSKRNARKTGRSSCKHHFMFMKFLTSLISTIDKRMVDNIYTRRDDSRPELKIELNIRTKYSN